MSHFCLDGATACGRELRSPYGNTATDNVLDTTCAHCWGEVGSPYPGTDAAKEMKRRVRAALEWHEERLAALQAGRPAEQEA